MTNLEEKIAQTAWRFDLRALLILLDHMGYHKDDILFRSYSSLSSQPSMIRSVKFEHAPARQVLITLNLGLLSPQSPLPSYFQKKVDYGDVDNQAFFDFIRFFDHQLIQNYLQNIYPETNKVYYPDWERTKRQYLKMMDLKSVSTLHWFFQSIFPELNVKVEKITMNRQLSMIPLILGEAVLGQDAVFGKVSKAKVNGRRLTLFSEEECDERGEPWPKEIQQRLDDLAFPILRPVGLDLDIVLVIRSQKRWAQLHRESYMGYDKIQGGEMQYRKVRIFKGYLKESGPQTLESFGDL